MIQRIDPLWLVVRDAEEWHRFSGDPHLQGARILVSSELLRLELKELGFAVDLWDDFFPAEKRSELIADIADLRRTRHRRIDRPQFAAHLEFDGVDLTELIEYGLIFALVEVLRQSTIVDNLMASARPERVIIGDGQSIGARILADRLRRREIPVEVRYHSPPATTAKVARAARPNPLAGLSRFLRTAPALRRFRRSKKPLRALIRQNRFGEAIVGPNENELEVLLYRRGGKQVESFLALASLFYPQLRDVRRRARKHLAELKTLYRDLGSPRLEYAGRDIWPYLAPALDDVFGVRRTTEAGAKNTDPPAGMCSGFPFDNPFAADKTRTIEEILANIVYSHFWLLAAQPDCVVVAQDTWDLDKAMVSCARTRNIPSAVLQHGVPAMYYPVHADRFLIWGEACADYYARYGESKSRLALTGRPTQPDPFRETAGQRQAMRSTLGVPERHHAVLFVGQPLVGLTLGDTVPYWERQLAAVFEAVNELDDVWLLVRPHPTEESSAYENVARFLGCERWSLARDKDLSAVVHASDAVILRDSTVSLDALRLGRPIIVLDLYEYPVDLPFDLDQIPIVNRAEDLAPTIRETLALGERSGVGEPNVARETDANRDSLGSSSQKESRFLAAQIAVDGPDAARAVYRELAKLAAERK